MQIVANLNEVEAGIKVEQVCQTHGISNATCYNWKRKYGDMDASDVKRLEEENSRLKKMYACLNLEHEAVKGLIVKKDW